MQLQQQPHYVPHGVLAEAWASKDPLALVDGPAGTGKSRMWLERVDALARKYPGSRHYICRKTRKSITTTAQVTFENFVLPARSGIKLHKADQVYPYPNGSIIGLLGLDDTEKTKSLEADTIYINEATECSENDIEMLIRALRWPVMPWKQISMDCNPDAPTHWLFKAFTEGRVRRFISRHKDNPYLWHQELQRWTEKALGDLFDGKKYIAALELLTGVRRRRLLLGEWCAAEGAVYDTWDDAIHLVDWFRPPDEWPRYWTVDFGYTDPFCAGMWAVDPDGRLYLYKHIYFTQRLVEDHAETLRQVRLQLQDPAPREVICDWDAEGRATLERHLGMQTSPATKHIAEGIQAVQSRLKILPDGKPRLMVMRDSLIEFDENLKETHRPTDGPSERPGYVWDLRNNRHKGELPIDKDNHFMDMERYTVAHFDLDPASMPAEQGASIW